MTTDQIVHAVEVLSRHTLGGHAAWRASFDGSGCRGVYAGKSVLEPAVAVAIAAKLEPGGAPTRPAPDDFTPAGPAAGDYPGHDPRFAWTGDDPGPLIGGA